jgi:uncharacterized protein (DUF433 family)
MSYIARTEVVRDFSGGSTLRDCGKEPRASSRRKPGLALVSRGELPVGAVDRYDGQPHLVAMTGQRIVIDPAVCGGRPIVAGTRMRVSDVLDALASGASFDELLADFPYLAREDVLACLAYGARAVDHSVVQAA